MKHSNLSRFLNSIGEDIPKSKQNVVSLRVKVDNEIAVILCTKKKIKKSQELLYNYD